MTVFLDIWSDIACPWCYIGKRRLEAALERFDGDVEITYRSFELSPDTPVDFEGDEVDFLSQHKGMPREQVVTMLAEMTELAATEGLAYDFAAVRHTSTVKAHQLLHLARQHGLQRETKERLLSAYFVEGRHLGRVQELADLAAEVGLDRDEVVRALEADAHLDDVRADQALAARHGISGVPFFVLDGRWAVSGAQSPDVLLRALEHAAEADGEGLPD